MLFDDFVLRTMGYISTVKMNFLSNIFQIFPHWYLEIYFNYDGAIHMFMYCLEFSRLKNLFVTKW